MAKSKSDKGSSIAYRRSLELTDAVMFAKDSVGGNTRDIIQGPHGQRAPKAYSEQAAGKREENADTPNSGANLIYGDKARIPLDCDTLVVAFNALFISNIRTPESNGRLDVMNAMNAFIQAIEGGDVFERVGRYYAYNICSGAWLWRNRDVSRAISISVDVTTNDGSERVQVDNALKRVRYPRVVGATYDVDDPQVEALGAYIAKALRGETNHAYLRVRAECLMAPGQEVWPSQLYVPGKPAKVNNSETEYGRQLHRFDGCSAMTAEKIGNALRTYDNSHRDSEYDGLVIPVEPNGSVLSLMMDLRKKERKNRFHDYLDSITEHVENQRDPLDGIDADEQVYILGCLVRGGLFTTPKAKSA